MLGSAKVFGYIATSDFERAKAFYRDKLGLRLASTDDFACVFETGGISVRVVKIPGFAPAGYAIFGWRVGDLDQTVAALAKLSITFERYAHIKQDAAGIWDEPGRPRVAWFKDPDGNLLSVSSDRAG